MEFKKCDRCGCFFISEDNVCCNCKPKDRADTIKLHNFIEENGSAYSIEEISASTGITIKNLSRFGEIQNINGITEKREFKFNTNIEL